MSRLRRPFLYDRYIFVTVDLLRGRGKLEERDFGRLAISLARMRQKLGFLLVLLCYVNPLVRGEAAKRRQTVAHGASRGLLSASLTPAPLPPARERGAEGGARAGSPRACARACALGYILSALPGLCVRA